MAPAQDTAASERASIRVNEKPDAVYVGQPVRLEVVVTIDAPWFEKHAIQSFTRRLDVPVRLEAPWLRTPPGAPAWTPESPEGAVSVIAVNDDLVPARDLGTLFGGSTGSSLGLRWSLPTETPGEVRLDGTTLRFTWAREFDFDAFGDRIPRDPKEEILRMDPVVISVRELPEEGRPEGFSGLVGSTEMAASASTDSVEVGESLWFSVAVHSDGDLAACAPPDLGALDGLFHVKGRVDTLEESIRTFTWEMAPLSTSVTAIPSVEFSCFEPGDNPGYVTLATEALPLMVSGDDPPSRAGTVRAGASSKPDSEGADGLAALAIGLGLVLAGVIAAFLFLRKQFQKNKLQLSGPPVEVLLAELESGQRPPLETLSTFLASRLGRPEPSLVGAPVGRWLGEAGVSPESAERAASLLEGLRQAGYGGDPVSRPEQAVAEVMQAMEADLGGANRAS
jgi:hypothetical protein